jgi:diguanylate cyclase (GGDEF)-like protein/PAS domain S-box-containing protein
MNSEPLPVPRRPAATQRRWWRPDARQIVHSGMISVLFFVLYFLLDRSDILLESRLGFTIWYPPIGLAVALLLGLSPWYAPLVCIAEAISGAVIYHQPLFSWSQALTPASIAVWYGAAAYVLRDYLKIDLELNQRRDVIRYVSVTLAAAAGSTAIGVMSLVLDHTISPDQYWQAAFNWYAGDAIAILGVAPFLLIHVCPLLRKKGATYSGIARRHARALAQMRADSLLRMVAETLGQALSILAALWVTFSQPFARLQLFFLCFLPIIWIAMRQGIRQVVSGLLAFNFGVLIALQMNPQPPVVMVKTAILMLSVSLVGLTVGSAVSERHRIAEDLQERTTFLNALIESNPLGIVALDREGRVQLCNDAFEKLFQYRRTELVGRSLDDLIAPGNLLQAIEPNLSAGAEAPALHSVRRVRKDGTLIDVQLEIVPLKLGGYVWGSFGIYKDVSEELEAAELARDHAESLNRLVGELQLRTTQMTLLNEMSDLLQCCGSRNEAYAVVSESARKLFPVATAGALYTFRSSRNSLEAVATWGKWASSDYSPGSDECWALRRGRPNWSESPEGGVICTHIKNRVPASYLCVPLVAQGEALGFLHLQYDRSESTRGTVVFETLQESQQRLSVSAAGQIALSLASLRLQETLREQSTRDPLTSLFNRRYMQETLDREVMRAQRKNQPLAILFLDIDHFKKFNDSFGHDAGDLVLKAMADAFLNGLRREDVVCRYGGEEFAVIMPDSSAANAERRANQLRLEVNSLRLRHQGRSLDPVSLSVGVASYPENGTTADELLRAADQALYQSKAAGRNRVTVAIVQCV